MLCVLSAPLTSWSPISLPLCGPPYSLRHKNIEIRPINNPTETFKYSSKGKSHISLTLNQKLEMKKWNLVKKACWKTKLGQKLGLLCQTRSPSCKCKGNVKKIKHTTPVNTQMIRKQISLTEEEVLVIWIEDQTIHNILLSQSPLQSKALILFN